MVWHLITFITERHRHVQQSLFLVILNFSWLEVIYCKTISIC
ncbi:Uncharacterised protein [Klebsiella pneumoniae]|nr:Uncharacterised protein [Klebsiella pneumoniae]SYM53719.1 Uncharacterised protein [Klebsiella pneumoniae]SYM84111.1 Uncharacterised protein [Klebsiella pneumoniae]